MTKLRNVTIRNDAFPSAESSVDPSDLQVNERKIDRGIPSMPVATLFMPYLKRSEILW